MNWKVYGMGWRMMNWNWHLYRNRNRNLIVFFADVLKYVFTFMVVCCFFYYFEIWKASGPSSFSANFLWPLSCGRVAFLLDPCIAPRLNLLAILHFFCRLANLLQHLLTDLSDSFLIPSRLTALFDIFWDLTPYPLVKFSISY